MVGLLSEAEEMLRSCSITSKGGDAMKKRKPLRDVVCIHIYKGDVISPSNEFIVVSGNNPDAIFETCCNYGLHLNVGQLLDTIKKTHPDCTSHIHCLIPNRGHL
jgi:hypothetical protein